MSNHSQPRTARFAHDLRINPTPAEVRLWSVLRKRQRAGARFRRQHPIGPFVIDFCALRLKLVIEEVQRYYLNPKNWNRVIFRKLFKEYMSKAIL